MGRLVAIGLLALLHFVALTAGVVGLTAWLFGACWYPWPLAGGLGAGWAWLCLMNLIDAVGALGRPSPGVTVRHEHPTASFVMTPPAPEAKP